MTLLAVLRHGPTEWSAARRLQGCSDIPLSPEGRATVASWRLPPALAACRWLTSPLSRAVETAEILGLAARREVRLIEMAWGEWEGLSLADLRAMPDAALAEIASGGTAVGAVSHKGVIRALFALASGWDMLGKAPARLDWQSAHLFRLDAAGNPAVERLNVSLLAP